MDQSQKRATLENPSHLVYDRKFDTAIRDSFFDNFQADVSKRRALKVKQSFYDDFILDDIAARYPDYIIKRTPDSYAIFLYHILNYPRVMSSTPILLKKQQRIRTLVEMTVEIQVRFNLQCNYLNSRNRVLQSMTNWKTSTQFPKEILNLFMISKTLSKIVDLSQFIFNPKYRKLSPDELHILFRQHTHYFIQVPETHFHWSEKLFIMVYNGTIYIMPRSCMLMFHNKICDLLSVLLYARYSEGNAHPEETYKVTVQFVKELCLIVMKYQNNGFSILKTLEGLVIAETLVQCENWVNTEFLDNITDELYTSCKFNYPCSNLRKILCSVDIPLMHDLGCLSKIVGHPHVSMIGGVTSLYKKVNEPVEIKLSKVKDCICHFKRDYIKKHVQKHGKWPPTSPLPLTACLALRMAQLYGKDPDAHWIQQKFGKVSLIQYEFVTLEKNYEFNELENIIPYLKDKTITLLRSEIMQKYMDNLKPDKEWEKTRLLLAYMLNPTMVHDHIGYLRRYTRSNNFNQLLNYLIIRIVPKEKELKVDFRGFGAKTYEDRHRSLAQEKNVGIYLDEYSDEQTLTITELDLLKKLDAFRRITQAYKGYRALYIVIDASAWNNRFSSRTVDDFCQETLDKVFDSQIFSKTHKAFENTLIYTPDQDNMYYWEGQRGGIEGLNQYTWMTVYISQMKVCMQGFPFPYHILCKGDDMRIVVLIPESQYDEQMTRQLKNQIVTQISDTCRNFGHKINIEESYGSSHYFAFSKAASFDKIEMPQTFRKIQKVYGANNAFINTFDDYIASTFSNGHSACKVSPTVVPCYSVSLTWFFYYLTNSQYYGDLSNDQLVALALIPSLLGGFPIIYLHNFYVRAESDLLSPFISLYQFCLLHYNQVAKYMGEFLSVSKKRGTSLLGLYSDPYSLPISRPPLPSSVLRSYIPSQLLRISNNQDLLQLIALSRSKQQASIVNALDSCNVIRAKALSILYASSPKALLEQYLRKFESGKSVLDLLLIQRSRHTINKILLKVLKAEHRLQCWRVNKITHSNRNKDEESVRDLLVECPAESANIIREYSYGRRVEDITMPPLQHQLWITYSNPHQTSEWLQNNHFNYTISCGVSGLTTDGRLHYTAGPFTPFIGYKTRTGQINPSVHFVEKDDTLSKIKQILEVCNWMNVSSVTDEGVEITSNIKSLCECLLKLYTDTDLSKLAPFAGIRKSGTSQHHMRSPSFRESIVPNTLGNVYNNIKGESSSHVRLQSSSQHFRMNFLHCYCYVVWQAFFELEFAQSISTPRTLWAITTDCQYCNTPITETPLILDEQIVATINLPLLKITKINKIAEDILQRSMLQDNLKGPLDIENLPNLTYEAASLGILQYLVNIFYIDRESIVNRLTHHVVNDEGQHILSTITGTGSQRDVGLTEIKSLSIPAIVDNLLQIIANMIITRGISYDNEALRTYINVTPVHSFPWYGIVNWFFNAGRLPALIKEIYTRTQIPAVDCCYNVHNATRYLGIASIASRDAIYPARQVIYLSHCKDNSLLLYIRMVVTTLRDLNIREYCELNLIRRPPRDVTDEVLTAANRTIVAACILFCTFRLSEDHLQDIANTLNEQPTYVYRHRNYLDVSIDELPLCIDEELDAEYIQPIMRKIVNIHNAWQRYNNELSLPELCEMYYDSTMEYLTPLLHKFTGTFTVTYTSISECIAVVRANRGVREDAEDDIDTIELTERYLRQRRVPFDDIRISRAQLLLSSCELPKMEHDEMPYIGTYQHLDYYTSYSFIDRAHLYRIIGSANSSPMTLIMILEAFNFRQHQKRNQIIACIADGKGGFTSVCDHIFKQSIIFFHTHPDDTIFNPEPEMALANPSYENHIVYDNLKRGYTDLRLLSTVKVLCERYQICDYIFIDLEYEDAHSDDYRQILQNILILIMNLSHRNTLVICRLDLSPVEYICILLTYLRKHFMNVWLCYPKCETYSSCSYLILRGCETKLEVPHDNPMILAQVNAGTHTVQRVMKYIRSLNRIKAHQFHNSFRRPIKFPLYFIDLRLVFNQYIGTYGIHQAIQMFGLVTELSCAGLSAATAEVDDVNFVTEFHTQLIKEGFDVTPQIKHLKYYFRDNKDVHYYRQSWDANTQAHRQALLRTLFTMEGFEHAHLALQLGHGNIEINTDVILTYFGELCDRLDYRDLPDTEVSSLGNRILIDNFINQLWKLYLKGVITYIQIVVATYNCNTNYRRKVNLRLIGERLD